MTSIANAIRSRTGESATMTPRQMPAKIASIPSGSGEGIPREVDANGKYVMPTSDFSFSLPSNATDLANDVLYKAYDSCTHLVGDLDMSSLTAVTGSYCCTNAFRGTKVTSVDLGSVVTISGGESFNSAFRQCYRLAQVDLGSLETVQNSNTFAYAFNDCTALTAVDLSSLKAVKGSLCFNCAFMGCTSLSSVSLDALEEVSGTSGLQAMFQGCTSLPSSWSFTSLSNLSGSQALYAMFRGCTSLTSVSFPALTTSSFGTRTDQFNNMLRDCSGVTVHFPAAIQSTIGSWASVTAGFGGTHTTVLFDL